MRKHKWYASLDLYIYTLYTYSVCVSAIVLPDSHTFGCTHAHEVVAVRAVRVAQTLKRSCGQGVGGGGEEEAG